MNFDILYATTSIPAAVSENIVWCAGSNVCNNLKIPRSYCDEHACSIHCKRQHAVRCEFVVMLCAGSNVCSNLTILRVVM